MKYLIIGAGGTGGVLGAYLARGGKDVTWIARGAHLEAIQRDGLTIRREKDPFVIRPAQAFDAQSYQGEPDVIFVCVKGYSLEDTVPFLQRVATSDTIVIPILNIYGTGGKLQEQLPGICVTDGCIYVASQIEQPGVIRMNADILRVVFGLRPGQSTPLDEKLKRIAQELCECAILGQLSDNILRDALLKFSYVSAQGACGLYYHVPAGEIQKPGEIRDCFSQLVHEIDVLAQAMGISFGQDIVTRNLKILDDLSQEATTSMQRDVYASHASEIDGLIYEVVRLAKRYQVQLPMYEKIASALDHIPK